MIRLTIARYYTPSGRCIQKPYVDGEDPNYAQDLIERYEHGEYFSRDSIKHHGPAYHTGIGRVVYGGGGITPDIFVPEDTLGLTSYYKEAAMSGLILQFAFTYTDNNRQKMKDFKEMLQARQLSQEAKHRGGSSPTTPTSTACSAATCSYAAATLCWRSTSMPASSTTCSTNRHWTSTSTSMIRASPRL